MAIVRPCVRSAARRSCPWLSSATRSSPTRSGSSSDSSGGSRTRRYTRLYPVERAEAETFVEWFNHVWKRPANALAASQSPADADALWARIAGWTKRFETYLDRSPFLLGETLTVADVCAYPFLRYAVHEPDPGDDDRFHRTLCELLAPGSHPRLDDWVDRIAARPQA